MVNKNTEENVLWRWFVYAIENFFRKMCDSVQIFRFFEKKLIQRPKVCILFLFKRIFLYQKCSFQMKYVILEQKTHFSIPEESFRAKIELFDSERQFFLVKHVFSDQKYYFSTRKCSFFCSTMHYSIKKHRFPSKTTLIQDTKMHFSSSKIAHLNSDKLFDHPPDGIPGNCVLNKKYKKFTNFMNSNRNKWWR